MAGLAAARRRGRVGGRPTVITVAKTKQAARMVKGGDPADGGGGGAGGQSHHPVPPPQDHPTPRCSTDAGAESGAGGGPDSTGSGGAVGARVPVMRARTRHPGGGGAAAGRPRGAVASPRSRQPRVCSPGPALPHLSAAGAGGGCEVHPLRGWAHHHRGPCRGQRPRFGGLPGPTLAGGRRLEHRTQPRLPRKPTGSLVATSLLPAEAGVGCRRLVGPGPLLRR